MARDAGVEEEVDGAIEDAIDNIVLLGTNVVVVVVPDILVAEVLEIVLKAETATWMLLSTIKDAVKIITTAATIRDSRCFCRCGCIIILDDMVFL